MIFLIANIFVTFFFLKHFLRKVGSTATIQPNIFISRIAVGKIFFGMMSLESSTQRRKTAFDLWVKNIIDYGHDYGFCTSEPIEEEYKWIPNKNWGEKPAELPEDRDRKNKRVSAAEYFLKNTTADFYVSCSDDVIVDASRINELGFILQRKYDTNKDLILLGNCQYIPEYTTYLQGGSGYIMTRRMASEFVKHSKEWVNGPGNVDDVDIAKFLGYLGLKPENGTAPYMVGHILKELLNDNFNPQNLPKCPDFYEPVCRQGIHNIRDVYFVHAYRLSFEKMLIYWKMFLRIINDYKHQYGYYNTYPDAHVCLIK